MPATTQKFDYNTTSGLRATQIKSLAIGGPRALWKATYGEPSTSTALQMGTLTHLRILQPNEWADKIVVENVDRRTKEGKARAALLEETGKTICKPEDAENIETTFLEFTKATTGLFPNGYSTEVITTANIEGIDLKAQIDIFDNDGKIIVDLKTCSDIGMSKMDIWKWRYDLQLGHYANCIEGAVDRGDFKAYLVFVETSSPFRCKVYDLTKILPASRASAWEWAKEANRCLTTYGSELKDWPQPASEEIIETPAWIH